jgi:carbamoyl-phosphate synthase large subunit
MILPVKVMIAGIGGASLGTEIRKSLSLAGGYEIYGCDVSKTAYGLYEHDFARTWYVSRDNYIADVLKVCLESEASFLIPGGEQPMSLLGAAQETFLSAGIRLLANTHEVIALCSNKQETFQRLAECGIPIPRTTVINSSNDLDKIGLPCIVKPATGTGGSVGVFFAVSADEAMIYADFILKTGSIPIAQQYVPEHEGEFTVGVLSFPTGQIMGSIALQRVFDAKLSVAYRGRGGLISSGYSQGYIDEFQSICHQAEQIAKVVNSCGPINIQGRVQDGILLPFEINPRFSASTYLRALSGFNEVDLLIKYLMGEQTPTIPQIKPGWYLRSLTENFVSNEQLK